MATSTNQRTNKRAAERYANQLNRVDDGLQWYIWRDDLAPAFDRYVVVARAVESV